MKLGDSLHTLLTRSQKSDEIRKSSIGTTTKASNSTIVGNTMAQLVNQQNKSLIARCWLMLGALAHVRPYAFGSQY